MVALQVVVVFLAVAGLSPVWAADKVGFVDIQEIIRQSEQGKKGADEINKLYEKNKPVIQAREAELKKLKDELEKQRTILTELAWKEKEKVYEKKMRDYQILVKDANEELKGKEQDITKLMLPEIMKLIQAIGEKERYAFIMDVSMVPVAYHAKENDLTKRVTDDLNRSYKSPKK